MISQTTNIFASSSRLFFPSKSVSPVSISAMMHPNDHISIGRPNSKPRSTSGAR